MSIQDKYLLWRKMADESLQLELEAMEQDGEKKEDAFYKELEFGTAGLRGVIGAGSNRMNVHVVARASQGLADYIKAHFENGSVAVSYDSRILSDEFSKVASEVFAANGLRVYIYDSLMPTPCLSFAVRMLKCSAGIMVTASHNPAKYNGYKIYGPDGCQITTDAANEILAEIEKLDMFADVKRVSYDEAVEKKLILTIPESVYTAFTENIKAQSVLFGDAVDTDVSIVYSPLNGTGLKPVMRALKEGGFGNVQVVPEQEQPDGNFPTCPYPNPEIRQAMECGIKFAKKKNADILIATDPDCDRIGIAVRDGDDYTLLSGNEVGILLLDYICSQRVKHGAMPLDPVLVKTIVSIDLADKIAAHYGVNTVNVLTGFKYIGEQIGILESRGVAQSYIFGFEESYGYLTGTYVRDKDAVDGAYMICEMFAYYKTRGVSLLEKLGELYKLHGYCLNRLHSFEFTGSAGMKKMAQIMAKLRQGVTELGGFVIDSCNDYSIGIDGLPKSDVLKYFFSCGSVVVRPSGTEPKLKVYISVFDDCKENALIKEKAICQSLEKITL